MLSVFSLTKFLVIELVTKMIYLQGKSFQQNIESSPVSTAMVAGRGRQYTHSVPFKRGLKIECLTLAPAAKGISYMVTQGWKTVPSRFSIQASNVSHLHFCMCCS